MINAPTETVRKEVPAIPLSSDKEEADRKWKEAFANTTEEELERLEQMFMEEEAKNGTTPLEFKNDDFKSHACLLAVFR